MKNLKRALSLVLSAAMMVGMMAVGTSAAFADVDASDNLEAISVMEMIGVMEGDGTNFNPDRVVTRNEMAVVICNLMNLKLNGFHNFTDVPDWADKYVGAMFANGLTSGTSATTYGGAANVTTVEAALMILKTLGYFEYQGEFEGDWKLATIKKATEKDLFDDIDAGVNEGLTRGEVAQMVLNALSLPVVNAHEIGGLNVSGDGFSVSENAQYEYKTAYSTLANKLYNNTLIKSESHYYTYEDENGNEQTAYYHETDDFGRPAVEWTYTANGKSTTVTAAKAPAMVLTAKTNSDDMTKLLKEYKGAGVYYTIDGVAQSAVSKASMITNAETITGNGVKVEIFTDKYNNITDVVAIKEYVGKITLVNKADEAKDTKRSVVVDGMTFETEDFARKDMVKYTVANGKIKSMAAAESVEGKVTAVSANYIKIDGVTYKYNANFVGAKPGTDDDVKIYVDSYGYLLEKGDYTKAAAAISEYALVTEVANADTWGDINVKVLYADGTTAVLTWDPATTKPGTGLYTVEKTDDGYKFIAPETTTDTDSDNKFAGYEASATSGEYKKDKGTLNGWAIADDAVFFVNKNNGKFAVATGAELKKADTVTINAVYANKASTGFEVIEFGYVTSALSGTTDLLFGYVTADTETIKNADKVLVDYITLWNGTETVVYEVSAAGDTGLDKKDFFQFKLNADGEIDKASIVELFDTNAGTIEKLDVANEKIVISGTQYKLTKDAIIVGVDSKKVAGYAYDASDLEIADKVINADGTEGAYIANVCFTYKTNADSTKEITGLFFDINNLITVPAAPVVEAPEAPEA